MKLANTIRWRDTSGGIITNVSSDIVTANSIPFAINLDFDKDLGLAQSRAGTSRIGNQLSAGNACRGLHYFRDADGSNHKLFAAFNGSIYNVVGGSAEKSSLTVDADYNFITFMDAVLMLNGTDAASTVGAGTWITTGGAFDLANIPSGLQFPIEWHDRVYAAKVDQIHYTTIPDGQTVTWGGVGSGSIQVEREDGAGTIKGLGKVPGYLLIFKERSLKRWDFNSTYPDDLVRVGTQAHKSIVNGRGLCFFFYGPKGFYATNGGYPKLISRPIQRIIDAIPSAYFGKVSGWCDDEHVYWSIGDITVDFGYGYTEIHNNVTVRYTIDTQEWSVYKYAHEFRAWSNYINGTDPVVVAGDSDGQILQIATGNSDYSGNPITYILQSPEFDFSQRERLKSIADRIIAHAYPAKGAIVQARIDYKEWKEIGQISGLVSEISLKKPLVGHVFEFRLTDSITGEPVKLRGLDFPSVDIHTTIN